MVVAGKGGVQLPTVIARGRTRGQFGIWQSPCPRLLDPIRQPALWFQKQTWKIYSWAYPINCAECQPQLYRSFVINISAINRRIPHATVPGQGGHLGPVFIWIQSQQNNNTSTSHHVVNDSDEDSSEPTQYTPLFFNTHTILRTIHRTHHMLDTHNISDWIKKNQIETRCIEISSKINVIDDYFTLKVLFFLQTKNNISDYSEN